MDDHITIDRTIVSMGHEDTLTRVQRESHEWRKKAYPDTYTLELQALGVGEEVGELQHAILKHLQGIRGYDFDKTQAEVADAIGDIVIYACGVAQLLNIDVRAAVEAAWNHVHARNITQGSDLGGDVNVIPGLFPTPDDEAKIYDGAKAAEDREATFQGEPGE
jgi:NTP pyrophosphatase (non-canonical NTP hydrolase)